MGTLRHDFTRPGDRFTMLANEWLRDERLSFGAIGLLAHLHSHQEGWSVDMEALARRFQTGIRAIRAYRRELEDLGYLRLAQPHVDGGDFAGFNWTLADPTQPESALGRFAPSANAASVSAPSANRSPIEDRLKNTSREHQRHVSEHADAKRFSVTPKRREMVTDILVDIECAYAVEQVLSYLGTLDVETGRAKVRRLVGIRKAFRRHGFQRDDLDDLLAEAGTRRITDAEWQNLLDGACRHPTVEDSGYCSSCAERVVTT